MLPVVVGHTQLPPPRDLPVAVGFFGRDEGLLAYGDGRALRTQDGGRTWRLARAPRLRGLDVVSRTVAFGTAGRVLLRTDDAGRSWRRVRPLPFAGAVDFADGRHGWLSSGPRARATADGGRTWRRLRVPCGRFDVVFLALADARDGYAICGGVPATIEQGKLLYATSDGGRTWRLRASSRSFREPRVRGVISSQGHVGGIVFRDARRGFVVAGRVGLYATSDGGVHWRTALFTDDGPFVSSVSWPYALLANGELARRGRRGRWRVVYPHTLPPPDVFSFADLRNGIGVGRGDLHYDPAAILVTHDGGRTWRQHGRLRGVDGVTRLVRTRDGNLYAVAGRRVLRSTDGGRSWSRAHGSAPRSAAVLGRHKWIVVTRPCAHPRPNCPGTILRTADGGRSWQRVRLNMIPGTTLDFVTPRVGYAKDPWTPLYRTTDGGRTWRVVAS